MIDCIVNHMEVDELRNLVMHLQEVDEARGQLVFAQGEIIECFQRLYNDLIYKENSRIKLDCKMGSLRKVERELEEKYKEYMPVPCCEIRSANEEAKTDIQGR